MPGMKASTVVLGLARLCLHCLAWDESQHCFAWVCTALLGRVALLCLSGRGLYCLYCSLQCLDWGWAHSVVLELALPCLERKQALLPWNWGCLHCFLGWKPSLVCWSLGCLHGLDWNESQHRKQTTFVNSCFLEDRWQLLAGRAKQMRPAVEAWRTNASIRA